MDGGGRNVRNCRYQRCNRGRNQGIYQETGKSGMAAANDAGISAQTKMQTGLLRGSSRGLWEVFWMSRAERRREMRGQEKKEVTRVMTIAQIQQMKNDSGGYPGSTA